MRVDSSSGMLWSRAARRSLAVIGVGFIGVYAVVAIVRLRYPYELEWLEGGVVEEVARAMRGHQLYVEPSARFTPYVYTPFYFYASAAVAKIVGIGMFAPRLVSFLASLCALGCVGRLIHFETRDWTAAAGGVGLLAACYPLTGTFFDLARVDSLFIALLFCGLALARCSVTPRQFMLVGLVLSAAYFTKQSALLPALAVVPWSIHAGRRQAIALVGALVVCIGAGTLLANRVSDGWFVTYTLVLPLQHATVPSALHEFLATDLRHLGLAGAIGIAVIAYRWREASTRWFLVPVCAGLLIAAYTGRLHAGGDTNTLLPAYGGIAILLGIGVASIGASERAWERATVVVVAALQLTLLVYDPRPLLPSAANRRSGARTVAALRALNGSVWIPGHGWYLEAVGKQAASQSQALADVLRASDGSRKARLEADLRRAVSGRQFDFIVVDSDARLSYLPVNFPEHYRPWRRLVADEDLAVPIMGDFTAPATIWVPR